MASTFPPRLTAVTIDCADPERLASFWSALLGVEVEEREEEVVALAPQPGTGVGVHFRRVPEPKQGKNRAHLDFVVKDADGSRAQVTDLGGQILQRHEEDGWVWWVVADPEGNEACLVVASG